MDPQQARGTEQVCVLPFSILEPSEEGEMIRTFRYPLHPTKAQAKVLDTWIRLCRNLYNAALQHRRDAYKMAGKSVNRFDQQKELTEIRKADPEYAAVPRRVACSPLFRLEKAFQAFFRRVKAGQKPGYPRFQGRDRYTSFGFGTALENKVEGNRIWIPKLGWVKFHQYRPLKGKMLDVQIKRMARRWDLCVTCEVGVEPTKVSVRKAIGIDLGLSSFATLSNGTKIENPRHFKKSQELLARRQRSLSKKKRGSKSRKKAKLLVGRTNEHIANQRQDFHRKLAAQLFKKYDLIAHEDLNVKGMVQSNLAKSISDAGWAGFIRALASKAECAGKTLVPVNPRGTSQACSTCGQVVPKELSEREHHCDCGLVMDRDENAALNILALGRSVVEVRPKDTSGSPPDISTSTAAFPLKRKSRSHARAGEPDPARSGPDRRPSLPRTRGGTE